MSEIVHALAVALLIAACGDRAPPPLWPEPPPPTLARPIGQEPATGDEETEPSPDKGETPTAAAEEHEEGQNDAPVEPEPDPESGGVPIDASAARFHRGAESKP